MLPCQHLTPYFTTFCAKIKYVLSVILILTRLKDNFFLSRFFSPLTTYFFWPKRFARHICSPGGEEYQAKEENVLFYHIPLTCFQTSGILLGVRRNKNG
jgi:hypothetical protein